MLSTVTKLKRHVGIPDQVTSKDALLDLILEGVSAFIETECNRKFAFSEHTDLFTDVRATSLFLKQCPVSEVVEIKVGKHAVDVAGLLENDNLVIDSENGEVIYLYGWTANVIRVTYNAGYLLPSDESGQEESGVDAPALPADVELLALRLAARIYERRTAEGVASASPGSFSANYSAALDDDLKATLSKYRIPPTC